MCVYILVWVYYTRACVACALLIVCVVTVCWSGAVSLVGLFVLALSPSREPRSAQFQTNSDAIPSSSVHMPFNLITWSNLIYDQSIPDYQLNRFTIFLRFYCLHFTANDLSSESK